MRHGLSARLDDLITLDTKNPTDSRKLQALLLSLLERFPSPRIQVFSDSPVEVVEYLGDRLGSILDLSKSDYYAWDAIAAH